MSTPNLNLSVFAPLKDPDYFAQVFLDFGAPNRPNGADIDQHWLHEEFGRCETWKAKK